MITPTFRWLAMGIASVFVLFLLVNVSYSIDANNDCIDDVTHATLRNCVDTDVSVYIGVNAGYHDPWHWGPTYVAPVVVGPPPAVVARAPRPEGAPSISVDPANAEAARSSIEASRAADTMTAPRAPAAARGDGGGARGGGRGGRR